MTNYLLEKLFKQIEHSFWNSVVELGRIWAADLFQLLIKYNTCLKSWQIQISDMYWVNVQFSNSFFFGYSECLKSELVWTSDSLVVSHSQTVPISDTFFCLISGQQSWDTSLGHFILKIYNPDFPKWPSLVCPEFEHLGYPDFEHKSSNLMS